MRGPSFLAASAFGIAAGHWKLWRRSLSGLAGSAVCLTAAIAGLFAPSTTSEREPPPKPSGPSQPLLNHAVPFPEVLHALWNMASGCA